MAKKRASSRRVAAKTDAATDKQLHGVALRMLENALAERIGYAQRAGLDTFTGKRNVGTALGYLDKLTIKEYRSRYQRNEIAERVVESLPLSTWRSGAEIVEDDSPHIVTTFEEQWLSLAERLGVWEAFKRADIMAGLGNYATILIGAVGLLETELPRFTGPDGVLYFTPYSEEEIYIKPENIEYDSKSPRFGLPKFYIFKPVGDLVTGTQKVERKVHWSRIIHVADGALDDRLMGKPRLRSIWNRLDDLDKCVGAGCEAFWQLVQPGLQLKIDKDVELTPDAREKLKLELDEWMHGIRRIARLRAATLEPVGESNVNDFSKQVEALIALIAAGSGIPQRILMGSERGELASQQDRSNWDQRVADRRSQFAGPLVVRQTVTRFIEHGALSAPVIPYEIRWPSVKDLSDQEIAETATKWAEINHKMGEQVVTPDEIRDRILGMPPLDAQPEPLDVETPAEEETELEAAKRRTRTRARMLSRRFFTKGRYRRVGEESSLIVKMAAIFSGKSSEDIHESMRAWASTDDEMSTLRASVDRIMSKLEEQRAQSASTPPAVHITVPSTRRTMRVKRNARGLIEGVDEVVTDANTRPA